MKRNLLKLALCAMAALPIGAWAQTTWDFTDNTKWNTIAASSGTVYYTTDGSVSNSTAFNLVVMNRLLTKPCQVKTI